MEQTARNPVRSAAKTLVKETGKADENNERYVLIGHSHGGSVILNAAIQSAAKGMVFPKLSSVITVGTPFIQSRASTFLSYLTMSDIQRTQIVLSVFASIYMLAILVHAVLIALAIPVLFFYLMGWNRLFWRHSHFVKEACRARLASCWSCLFDLNDEAIRGLGSAYSVQPMIFPRGARFSTVSGAIQLTFVIAILISGALAWLGVDTLTMSLFNLLGDLAKQYFIDPLGLAHIDDKTTFLSLVVVLGVLLLLSMPAFRALMAALDKMTWAAIKKSLLGADTEDVDYRVNTHPDWMTIPFNPLPPELSDELNSFSDSAAANSIPRLRRALTHVAGLANVADPNKSFAKYLTWNELVHTSYFQVPRFRKLVYYIIANSEGFKRTQAFLDDPDYKLVEQWYQEIQPRASEGT